MRDRILAVAKNGWVELNKKGALIILAAVFILGFLLPAFIQHWLLLSKGASIEVQMSKAIPWFDRFALFVGLIVAMLFAAGSVESEVSKRTLCSVMIRPIHRWEYLAGRVLSVEFFFLLFVLTAIVFSYSASVCFGCSLPDVFLLGIIQRFCRGFMWIMIALSLGAVTSSVGTMTLITILAVFSFLAPRVPGEIHWIVPVVQKLVHYIMPGVWVTDFFDGKGSADRSLLLEAGVLIENLMYGIAIFIGCSWSFTKRDLKLR